MGTNSLSVISKMLSLMVKISFKYFFQLTNVVRLSSCSLGGTWKKRLSANRMTLIGSRIENSIESTSISISESVLLQS